ncbi:chromodomain-helicase-DNA-binding protein 1 homolog, putative [Plasmodium vivax]|uniref:Chromodomain-helicase-DNA-binding protein 1 homolog, putative n=1 Tax=Plasmodium vivax TaxID=5855 RepID=A0A1G4H9P2_PLAVI|nr:chromodomain-helicase-DNA-binding protein 1 homolog, putative [Plasmodium vivax]
MSGNNPSGSGGSSANMRDAMHYGEMMEADNAGGVKGTAAPSSYMNQVNSGKNLPCAAAPPPSSYINNASSVSMGKGSHFNPMPGGGDATISITSSLLSSNEQNLQMRQQMGMNKNCGAASASAGAPNSGGSASGAGAGLHDAYQKPMLSSYNMNNMQVQSSMGGHHMVGATQAGGSGANQIGSRYNNMNYPMQDMNPSVHMNSGKGPHTNSEMKANNKDPNFMGSNNMKPNTFVNNMYYQRNDMMLRNSSNSYNMHGNFYGYMNNGFYGGPAAPSNCFKPNANMMSAGNGASNSSGSSSGAAGSGTGANYAGGLNAASHGEGGALSGKLGGKGPSGVVDKSASLKSIQGSNASSGGSAGGAGGVGGAGGASGASGVSGGVNASQLNVGSRAPNGGGASAVGGSNSSSGGNNPGAKGMNKGGAGGGGAGPTGVDSAGMPNSVMMNMVNNKVMNSMMMGGGAAGSGGAKNAIGAGGLPGMNMSGMSMSGMNMGGMSMGGMSMSGMNMGSMNMPGMHSKGMNGMPAHRPNSAMEKGNSLGDVNNMRYHHSMGGAGGGGGGANVYNKMGFNNLSDYPYDNYAVSHMSAKGECGPMGKEGKGALGGKNANKQGKGGKNIKDELLEKDGSTMGMMNSGSLLSDGKGKATGGGISTRKGKSSAGAAGGVATASMEQFNGSGMMSSDQQSAGVYKKYSKSGDNQGEAKDKKMVSGSNSGSVVGGGETPMSGGGASHPYSMFPNYNIKYPMNVEMFGGMGTTPYGMQSKAGGAYPNMNMMNGVSGTSGVNEMAGSAGSGSAATGSTYGGLNKLGNMSSYNMMGAYGDNRYSNLKSMDAMKPFNEGMVMGAGGAAHHGGSSLGGMMGMAGMGGVANYNVGNVGSLNSMNSMNSLNSMNSYVHSRNYPSDMNMRMLSGRGVMGANNPANMCNSQSGMMMMGAGGVGAPGAAGAAGAVGAAGVGMRANASGDPRFKNEEADEEEYEEGYEDEDVHGGGSALYGGSSKYVRKNAHAKQTNKTRKSEAQKKDKKKKKKKKHANNNSLDTDEDEDDNDLYVNTYVKKSHTKSGSKKTQLYDPLEDLYNNERAKRNEKNDIFVSPHIGAVEGRTNLRERRKVNNYAQMDSYFETDEEDKKVDEEKMLLRQEKQIMGGIDRVLHHRRILDYENVNNIGNNPFLYINKGGASPGEGALPADGAAGEGAQPGEGTAGANAQEDPTMDDFYEEEDIEDVSQVEFLIKWIGKSHIHNFFCTYDYLKHFNGLKKVDNYIKKIKQSFQKRKYMTADEIEQEKIYSEIKKQIEMDAIHAERIVTHRVCEVTGEQLFLVKWMSCAYDQCTEETKQTLVDHGFTKLIEEYFDRESKICGVKAISSAWNRGPLTATKFDPYNETPFYLNGKKLRAYQLTGLNWMVSRMKRSLSVLLADEMGLGKTVQTIAVVGHMLYKEKLIGPYLVIVPQSTVDNWLNEFKSWLPQANVVCYHGNAVSRELIRTHELKKVYVQNKGYRYKFDVCITTPSILNSLSDVELLKKMPWQLMVVDEAHQLKNRQSKRFIELKQFMAESKLLLSGTPLHNNLEELWTLLHFLNPQQYTHYENFQKKYNEIENTSLIGEAKQKQLMQLQHELHEVILRRVKKDVEKSLPNKVERILRVELSPIQIEFYKNILTKNYEQLAKASGGAKNSLQNICMELKKVCNHPFLCCEPVDKDEYKERLVYSSGKICLLEKLLIRLKERGNRVLIFSQMVKMLNILSEYLTLRGFKHQRLDGTMSKEMRKKAMNHFNSKNSDDFVFLLSTKAGGLGINLTSADTVIIYDSDWNPQNDLQAGARAHRIGQTKTVQIYRLVTKDSIEQTILERAKVKMVLDTLVVQGLNKKQNDNVNYIGGEGGNTSNGFTREELSKILKFGAQKLWEKNSSKYSPQKMDEEKAVIKGVDVDLDKILEEAEAHENANNANKDLNSELNSLHGTNNLFPGGNSLFGSGAAGAAPSAGAGGGGIADDLLSSYNNITEFKYEPPANLKSNIYNDSTKADELEEEEQNDKDFWDRTIPLEERLKLKRMKEEELLVHGPRKTRTRENHSRHNLYVDSGTNTQMMNDDDDDSEEYTIKYHEKNKHLKKKRKRRTSTHITEKDKFRLYRSLLKFGNPFLRLDDIRVDSKLTKVDRNVILTELNIIVDTCKEIVEKVAKESSLKVNEEGGVITTDAVEGAAIDVAAGVEDEEEEEEERAVKRVKDEADIKLLKEEENNNTATTTDSNHLTVASCEDAGGKKLEEGSPLGRKGNMSVKVGSPEGVGEGEAAQGVAEEGKANSVAAPKECASDEGGAAGGGATAGEAPSGGGLFSKLLNMVKGQGGEEKEVKEVKEAKEAKEADNENNSNEDSDGNNKAKGVERGRKIDAYTFYIGTNRANALDLCQRLQLFKSLHEFVKEQNGGNEYSFRLPLRGSSGSASTNVSCGAVEGAQQLQGKNELAREVKEEVKEEVKGEVNEEVKEEIKEEIKADVKGEVKDELNSEEVKGEPVGGAAPEAPEAPAETKGEASDYLKLKLPDYIFNHLRDLATKDVKAWSKEDDENLIKGVYVYGFGAINEICADVHLNLGHIKNVKCDKVKVRCVRILKMIDEFNSNVKDETTSRKRRRARNKSRGSDGAKVEGKGEGKGAGAGGGTSSYRKMKQEDEEMGAADGVTGSTGGTNSLAKGSSGSNHRQSYYSRRSSERVKAIYMHDEREDGVVTKKRAVCPPGGSQKRGEKAEKGEKGEKAEKGEKTEKAEKAEKAEGGESALHGERRKGGTRSGAAAKGERSANHSHNGGVGSMGTMGSIRSLGSIGSFGSLGSNAINNRKSSHHAGGGESSECASSNENKSFVSKEDGEKPVKGMGAAGAPEGSAPRRRSHRSSNSSGKRYSGAAQEGGKVTRRKSSRVRRGKNEASAHPTGKGSAEVAANEGEYFDSYADMSVNLEGGAAAVGPLEGEDKQGEDQMDDQVDCPMDCQVDCQMDDQMDCQGEGQPDGEEERKREKKYLKKKKKKKKLSDDEVLLKIQSCNLKEMNQHSMNKLAKKYVKKYKKLLKVVKKITQLGEQAGGGEPADQGASSSAATAATPDKWKSPEIKKKISEFVLFMGNHISKLADVCPDKECGEILSSSGWEYVSKFLGETSESLKGKYSQGQRELLAKEPSHLEESKESEDGGNCQGSVTEDDLAAFFFSKRISSMCRLQGVEEAEEEDEDDEDDDEQSHDHPKRGKSMTSINYEVEGTTSTFTPNGKTRRNNNSTGDEDDKCANDSNGDYGGGQSGS